MGRSRHTSLWRTQGYLASSCQPNPSTMTVLETDASITSLGTVLSQVQGDGRLHPVAYSCRSLNPQEENYSVTEFETLAVVWAMSHYHYYLYGHSMKVYTDHSAVKAILDSPNPTGKYTRWWTRVYSRGVKDVQITHRAGKENVNAATLCRSPQAPPSYQRSK